MRVENMLMFISAGWMSLVVHALLGLGVVSLAGSENAAKTPNVQIKLTTIPFEEKQQDTRIEGAPADIQPASAAVPPHRNSSPASLDPNSEHQPELSLSRPRLSWKERLKEKEKRFQEKISQKATQVSRLMRVRGQSDTAVGGVQFSLCRIHRTGSGAERTLEHLGALVPSASLDPNYLSSLREWAPTQKPEWRKQGVSRTIILPPRQSFLLLDAPAGVLAAVGRDNTACRVGVTLSSTFFPITLTDLPVDVVFSEGRIASYVLDVVLHANGTIEVRNDGLAPFKEAKLPYADQFAAAVSNQVAFANAVLELKAWLEESATP